MNQFKIELKKFIKSRVHNNYGAENFDSNRFGEYNNLKNDLNISFFKLIIKKIIGYDSFNLTERYIEKLTYIDELEWLWDNLNQKGKRILIELIAYRLMGYEKVLLSRNNREYKLSLKLSNEIIDFNDYIEPGFMHFILYKMDLNSLGMNIKLYFTPAGISIDFILAQYTYKEKNKVLIDANKDDVVLDVGGCWGDTALFFANKIGKNGKVYSFEFIPNNISIFEKNINLNPHLKDQIVLISSPVSNKSGNKIFYKDNGPGSQVKLEPFVGSTGTATTISIDDFVEQNNLSKVDFIKMDIEGAEPFALNGAINTIKKFKPKLAIAIYHSMSDFVEIPKWIVDLNLGYKLYLDHYTIHSEETVIFASTTLE
jgi:FkbM family methyltransferase